jgi:hypothetical protein
METPLPVLSIISVEAAHPSWTGTGNFQVKATHFGSLVMKGKRNVGRTTSHFSPCIQNITSFPNQPISNS